MNPIRTAAEGGGRLPLGSGLFAAIIGLGAGALLLSLLLRYSALQETSLPALAMTVHGISAAAGGFVTGRKARRKGWYCGLLLGVIYAAIIIAVGFLAADAPLNLETLLLLIVTAGTGMIGGMFGVGTGR